MKRGKERKRNGGTDGGREEGMGRRREGKRKEKGTDGGRMDVDGQRNGQMDESMNE